MDFEKPEGDTMETPEESPQARMENELKGIEDYGDKVERLEKELKTLKEAEEKGESVDSEYRDYLEKMRKEWQDALLEGI